MLRFDAPWSSYLTFVSVLITVVLLVVVLSGAVVATALVGGSVVVAAVLSVRGYTVEPGELVIHRLGWNTRLDLSGLQSAEADPAAMRWAIRTCGIGGPFAFVGRHRNRRLGGFTAYATDRDRAVVLRWPHRTVVVTPDDPDAFATAVAAAAQRDVF